MVRKIDWGKSLDSASPPSCSVRTGDGTEKVYKGNQVPELPPSDLAGNLDQPHLT